MLEAELAFVKDVSQLLDIVEECVQDLGKKLLGKCPEDVDSIRQFSAHEQDDKLTGAIDTIASGKQFVRMSYNEAVSILRNVSQDFQHEVSKEAGLFKEHEHYLVNHCGGSPVFVTEFPAEQKPFYMKLTKDHSKALCFDLLGSGVGELCGGSLRENDFRTLERRLQQKQLHSQLKWYLDLRQFGHAPLGGFGIGFERLLQCLFGIRNVKDCLPFPRWYKSCLL